MIEKGTNTVANRILDRMSEEQLYLLHQSMNELDRHYDEGMQLVRNSEDGDLARHSTRSSAHYAIGLLSRQSEGDLERACAVLNKVLEMQLDAPDEIYHGTFLTTPQAKLPPKGNYPWKSLGAGHAYFLASTFEKIAAKMVEQASGADGQERLSDEERQAVRSRLWSAVDEVLPPVWNSYDPNWREFIGCAFAIILELFESMLPAELTRRMDAAMKKTVAGSIDRRLSDAIPMNTNIELMHMFIADFYGARFRNAEWIAHAKREAASFVESFREFGTFAEFNSTTYYGVDLTVLGLIRQFGKLEEVRSMGQEVEQGLWNNIALYYNANLENLSGPFSRAYDMEMREHSSMGVFIYLALGAGYEHLAGLNCESAHDPMIALVGVNVPEPVLPVLKSYQTDRYAERQFRELCERHEPGKNSHLCTATAWIERDIMIGGLSGSRNTSGQLHPATIHWMTQDGNKYYLRLLRREVGGHWSTHLRGIVIDARAAKDELSAQIELNTDRDIEVLFEIIGPNIGQVPLSEACWKLPGITLNIEAEAPAPHFSVHGDHAEIIYTYRAGSDDHAMRFKLSVFPN